MEMVKACETNGATVTATSDSNGNKKVFSKDANGNGGWIYPRSRLSLKRVKPELSFVKKGILELIFYKKTTPQNHNKMISS